jgi:Xaa-Pro aminopeptidase
MNVLTSNVYRARLARVADALRDGNVDALLLTSGADLFYLTGFAHGHAGERLLALVLRADGTASWIAPRMNVEQVRAHAPKEQVIRAWADAEWYVPSLREALQGARSVAFDDEARAGFLLDVLAAAPDATLHRASSVMRRLRMRKDSAELEALRAAGRTVDDTIAEAMSFCKPGRTEADVDRDLRATLLARAPESTVAFTIVASGPNAALPHHETGSRVIEAGDVVIVDFGTRGPTGYHSDITVTCCAGKPRDPEVLRVYRAVHGAQQAAIEAVRPGVTCEEVDRAARSYLAFAGYGEFFLHRVGHGLGLQVHEPPYLVGGNREVLEEGMVFSIEPGVYLPGRFGVRLEVIAAVTSDGASLINRPSAPDVPIVPG